ncbi:MAG: hypothetical protein AAF078_05485 [Planctomycetota bacterium]
MSQSPTVPVDAQGRVNVDLPCMKCGYNLRTLPLDTGRCPECALPVGRSAVGNRLRYCDPDWLRQIGWGLNVFVLSVVLVVSGAGSFAIMGASAEWDAFLVVPATLWACLIVAACCCVWKITKPDPMTRKDEWRVNPRSLSRVALIFAITLPIAMVIASGLANSYEDVVATVTGFGRMVTVSVGRVCLFLYVGQLAARAQARRLLWFTRLTVAASLIAATANVVYFVLARLGLHAWIEQLFTPYLLAPSPGNPPNSQTAQQLLYFGNAQLAIGPWRFDGWWQVWELIRTTGLIATVVSIALGLVAMLWLWPVVWRRARQARETWAGPTPTTP